MKNNKGMKAKTLYTFITLATFWFFAVASSEEEDVEKEIGDKEHEIEVSAYELIQAYGKNEVAADNKYKGKILLVTGTVDDIAKDIVDTIYITMGSSTEFRSVQCYFSDKQAEAVGNLSKGDRVSIKGKCDGLFGNVHIKGSRVVK